MKKILNSIITVVICCLLCVGFSACSLFETSTTGGSNNTNGGNVGGNNSSSGSNSGGSGNGSNSTITTYSVKVVYDDESLNFNFSSSSNISITPRYKTGYVLEGYYSQSGGNGELMIDFLGQSVSANWAQSKTNIIYPYYTKINYDYVYTSSMLVEEEPDDFHYNIYGAIYASILLNYNKSVYIYKACVSNPTLKVNITAYADVRATHSTTGKMYLALASKPGSEQMRKGELKYRDLALTTSFEKNSLSIEWTASTVLGSKDKYLGIGFITNGTIISYYTGYVKNIYFTMSFIN